MSAARLSILLLALLLLAMAAGLMIGTVPVSLGDLLGGTSGAEHNAAHIIALDIRLPRVVAAALTGLALGASGAGFQGLLRNPLAEPGVMGTSACAALAATGVAYFGLADALPFAMPLAAIAGAIAATALVAATALRQRGIASMILIGVSLTAIAGAVMALFINLAPNPFSLSDLINWTAGSVANRDWPEIGLAAPFILAGTAILWMVRRDFSALAFGEEVAFALGVNLTRSRIAVIIGAGLATGGAVSLAGMIGFAGLIAPHMVKRFVGHDAGATILPASLAGALLLVVADTVIRLIPWGNELHLGTLAALIGAPLFALLAVRSGNVRHV